MTTARDVIVNAVRGVFESKKYPWTPQGVWELESDLEAVPYIVVAKVKLETVTAMPSRDFTVTLRVHGCDDDVVIDGRELG